MSTPPIYSTRASRRRDQALADQAAAAAKATTAEAQLKQIEATTAAQLAALKVEQARDAADEKRRAAAAKATADAAERKRQAKARRRAERAAARQRLQSTVMRRRELLVTIAVIALSVSIALPAQIGFLLGRWPVAMAVPGGIVPEALTWAFAIQGKRREDRGLSARPHHLGTWCSALTAASINLTHGSVMWGTQFGVIAAIGSLAAPILWHTYRQVQSLEDDGLTPEQIRFQRRRRRHHRKVARVAGRIRTAAVVHLTEDEAWVLAWRAVHGAEPGITADLLAGHQKAAAAIERLLDQAPAVTSPSVALDVLNRPGAPGGIPDPDAVRRSLEAAFASAVPVDQILGSGAYVHGRQALPAGRTDDGRADPPGGSGWDRTGGRTDAKGPQVARRIPPAQQTPSGKRRAPMSKAARTAARDTAKRAQQDAAEMDRKRTEARAEIARILAAGGTPSPSEIGRMYGLSAEWGGKQIRAVREGQDGTADSTR